MSAAAGAPASAPPTPVDPVRERVIEVLITESGGGFGLPVLPLIDLVLQYVTFRGLVTTVREMLWSHVPASILAIETDTGTQLIVAATQFLLVSSTGETCVPFAGAGPRGFEHGPIFSASFNSANAICIDPLNPKRFFAADDSSIRLIDTSSGTVSLVAGSARAGRLSSFNHIADVKCTGDGRHLLVCDTGNQLVRCVEIRTGQDNTVIAYGPSSGGSSPQLRPPQSLVFDGSSETCVYVAIANRIMKSQSVDHISLWNSYRPNSVYLEFDIEPKRNFDPHGLVLLPSGLLLFSCVQTNSIYTVNPTNGKTELIAGSGEYGTRPHQRGSRDGWALGEALFHDPFGIAVVQATQTAYVADSTNRTIRAISLSPHLFTPRKE